MNSNFECLIRHFPDNLLFSISATELSVSALGPAYLSDRLVLPYNKLLQSKLPVPQAAMSRSATAAAAASVVSFIMVGSLISSGDVSYTVSSHFSMCKHTTRGGMSDCCLYRGWIVKWCIETFDRRKGTLVS